MPPGLLGEASLRSSTVARASNHKVSSHCMSEDQLYHQALPPKSEKGGS